MKIVKSVPGSPFQEVLALLMAHALGGAESESDPYVLSRLVREYVAWALALYYQCDHCNHHHHKVIVALQKKEKEQPWPWEKLIAETVLFTRAKQSDVSVEEWQVWEQQWSRLTHIMSAENARIVTLIQFAIGIARDDKDLVRYAFGAAAGLCSDTTRLQGVVRDVFRVVVAMKAATTQFRIEADIKTLLEAAT